MAALCALWAGLTVPATAQNGSAGARAFQQYCTQCHDAERALSKRKSPAAWLATVRRMAAMDDAEIPDRAVVPIAMWLAQRAGGGTQQPAESPSESGEGAATSADGATEQMAHLIEEVGRTSASATISTIWRGGNDNLENPDFFPDVWARLDMQPAGPLRGRVTACTSCHSDQSGDSGFTLELVEAYATLDLLGKPHEEDSTHCPAEPRLLEDLQVQMGRFVVPFGAFAARSHPGAYRTVTNPLVFNMGRQVDASRARPPVIPMPYADEGVNLSGRVRMTEGVHATFDVYGVNGLRGAGGGIRFTPSRGYADNNDEPALGGRATLGGSKWRVGGSIMGGRMHDSGGRPLQYKLAGADAMVRLLDDDVRLHYEYALRENDTLLSRTQIAYGHVGDLELRLWREPGVSALFRYDDQTHRDVNGSQRIERYTWGFTTTAFHGTLLMVNHEHWRFSGRATTDVLGIRWVVTL